LHFCIALDWPHLNFLIQSVSSDFAGRFKVIPCLKIHPKMYFHPKKTAQTQSGICRDATLAVNNFTDATRWYTD